MPLAEDRAMDELLFVEHVSGSFRALSSCTTHRLQYTAPVITFKLKCERVLQACVP